MSLNEKYIINGSTLSDIGDALRTSGLISPTKEITKLVWYRTNSGSASGSSSSTSTINQSFFQTGNAVWDGTIAKVKIVITSGNPKINGVQYYEGNTVTVDIPCTMSISGSIAYPSRTISYGCKVYPLTSDGQNIDCTQTSSYGGVYSESTSVEVPNTIAVEDIATSISQFTTDADKIQFLAPFCMGGYSNYSSYSTVLPEDIHTITDIKKLYVIIQSGSSSYIRVAKLEPAIATKTTYQSLGGDLGAGTTYRMKYYDFPRTTAATANWDTSLNQSTVGYYDIFYKESTRQLVQIGGGSTTVVNAIGVAALLIY